MGQRKRFDVILRRNIQWIAVRFCDTLKDTNVVGRSTDQDSDQDSPVNRLLAALGNEELSAAEIMNRLGLSRCPTFRKNYLTPTLDKRLIEHTIPDENVQCELYQNFLYKITKKRTEPTALAIDLVQK